jgi:hypothetical protein
MAKKFLTGLNLVVLDADPATGSEGELYFNSSASVAKIYQAGAWSVLGAGTVENTDYITFDTTPETSSSEIGTVSWNELDGTLNVKLSSDVTLQVGQEQHVRVHNGTGSTITNGTVVYVNGASDTHGHISVAPYIADGSVNVFNVMGLATSDILDEEDGYVTLSGLVRGLDTSSYTAGDSVFASDTVPGGLTTTQPVSPSETVSLGVVTVSDETEGIIFVQIDTGATADLVTYDNSTSNLIASNVAAAIDELALTKADINSLSSNITTYPTTASVAGISGYYRMVSSTDDTDYNDTAADVSTGNLNGTGVDNLVASLVADANLFVGTPGSINITTVGNIRKTSGNQNAFSEFFFRVYKRTSGGTETLLGTSSTTGEVNPATLNQYEQFFASANCFITEFSATDRIVIKYYSNVLDDGEHSYEFQFGGVEPVRSLIPVPISVIPSAEASGILVDTSGFNGVLSASDSNVQSALETIDNIVEIPDQTGHNGEFLTTTGTSLEWITASSASIATTEDLYDYLTTSDATLLYQPISVRLFNLTGLENVEGFLRTDGGLGWGVDTATYLTTSSASSTYLTQLDAQEEYLTQIDALNTFLTFESLASASVYQPLDGNLTAITELSSGSPGFLKKNIFNEWVIDSNTYLTTFDAGETYQPVGDYATIDGIETLTNKTISSPIIHGDLTFNGDLEYHTFSASANSLFIDVYDDLYIKTNNGSIILQPDEFVKIYDEIIATREWVGYQDYLTVSGASASYSPIDHNHTLDSLSNVEISSLSDGDSIVWNSASSKWINQIIEGGGGSSVTISSSAPVSPSEGDLWFDSDTLELFIYDSLYWIEVSGGGTLDLSSYLTIASASSTYLTQSSASLTYLSSESDTLETVTGRGATSSNAITISNTTEATDSTTGALIVSGGVGVAKDLWVDGNLHVAGTTTTENTRTVATHDNLIYLNAALDSEITGASGDGTYVTYIAENLYTVGMDIRVTGVDPSSFNISTGDLKTVYAATASSFVVESVVTDTYISGGISHAKEEANPDLGFAGGYYDAGYAHAGLFRDASDGIFKFFKGYTPEPDEAVNIDTGHVSFSLADVYANDVTLNNGSFSGSVSVGALISGEWNASTIGYQYGGTGLSHL